MIEKTTIQDDTNLLASSRKRPGSVLFICAMNAIRSPMAEYLTKDIFGSEIYVQSAGVRAGDTNGFAVAAMQDRGIDMDGHTPTSMEDIHDVYFDLIITLSPEAHHAALERTRTEAVDVEYWPTEDPSTIAGNRQQVLKAYIKVRNAIEENIKNKLK